MQPINDVNSILFDCFFAVGQAVGTSTRLDPEALAWWRDRYRHRFQRAVSELGHSWSRDRDRVMAVGRFLGQRALHHARGRQVIDVECAAKASAEVEAGCRMRAERR